MAASSFRFACCLLRARLAPEVLPGSVKTQRPGGASPSPTGFTWLPIVSH
jgi:hypothetical protein